MNWEIENYRISYKFSILIHFPFPFSIFPIYFLIYLLAKIIRIKVIQETSLRVLLVIGKSLQSSSLQLFD